MKSTALALCVVIVTSATAREWNDTKGRLFHGVLVDATASSVTFEKYGAGNFTMPLSTSSAPDREFVAAWRSARPKAILLNVTIFQATKTGALVSGHELRFESATQDVPKWFSKLDQKAITEKKIVSGWRFYDLPSDHVFIEGLDDVLDKWSISFLVVWPAGFYDYKSAGNAQLRVAKYTMIPPGLRESPSR